ncbi:sulfite reductase subunit alpha [Singulisphaera sp. PoT]|uniref:sulfite reductase subunit alpha n=1 Tax=Singulisphaera sp. PoT TaxID=3411797 RepID=UPI003BF4E8F7
MEYSLIPDSAPFNPEQRAWLNGFLAGWLGLQGATNQPQAPVVGAALAETAPRVESPAVESEPWHDPALGIEERLNLAAGRPLEGRLMAAMAQLDCGTCGYLCRTYARAIVDGSETCLTLCSPGGGETAKALKRLARENASGSPPSKNGQGLEKATVASGEYSRKNPFTARLLRSDSLSGVGSEKEVRHVEIDLAAGPKYEVGDSLGIFPENCEDLVDEILKAAKMEPECLTSSDGSGLLPIREMLRRHRDLAEITDELIEASAASASSESESRALRLLLEDSSPIEGMDLLDFLRAYPGIRLDAEDLVRALSPLKPRLYSISSSPSRHTDQVHLTVRRVSYEVEARTRKGVASTMLADRVSPGSEVRVYVQKSHGFALPADPKSDIIMVGPGTGIAPFRAFLHEREASQAEGRNWLFFGDQRSECDFLYREELTGFLDRKVLNRLDTAFSRDQGQKIYVQDRILEQGAQVYQWLKAGSYFYVCGDAKRMAADVDRALRSILREHGRMSEDEAVAYLRDLAAKGRYCRDVY